MHHTNLPKLIIVLLCFTLIAACRREREHILPLKQRQEEIFYTTSSPQNAMLLVINRNGDTLKSHKADNLVLDFRKWTYEGKVRYSYFIQVPDFYSVPGKGYFPGYRIITDTLFNEIKRVRLIAHNNIDVGTRQGVEGHDFILLADNHYLTTTYYEHVVHNIPAYLQPVAGIKILAAVVQEIYNDEVIWQWVSTDYPELYENYINTDEYTTAATAVDYLHLNSIVIDPKDNNIIMSCRHTDQLLKIDRKTGDIVWKLGGKNSDFVVPEAAKFLRQHDATISGNTILLLDNGEKDLRNHSRVVELDIDEQNMRITGARPYDIPGKYIQFAGNVNKHGDKYFIGGGSGAYIMEVNPRTNVKSFMLDIPLGTYRAFLYE